MKGTSTYRFGSSRYSTSLLLLPFPQVHCFLIHRFYMANILRAALPDDELEECAGFGADTTLMGQTTTLCHSSSMLTVCIRHLPQLLS